LKSGAPALQHEISGWMPERLLDKSFFRIDQRPVMQPFVPG